MPLSFLNLDSKQLDFEDEPPEEDDESEEQEEEEHDDDSDDGEADFQDAMEKLDISGSDPQVSLVSLPQ